MLPFGVDYIFILVMCEECGVLFRYNFVHLYKCLNLKLCNLN